MRISAYTHPLSPRKSVLKACLEAQKKATFCQIFIQKQIKKGIFM